MSELIQLCAFVATLPDFLLEIGTSRSVVSCRFKTTVEGSSAPAACLTQTDQARTVDETSAGNVLLLPDIKIQLFFFSL